jgi:Phage tail lysozyme
MALTDSDGNQYNDMGDYTVQFAQNQSQTQIDKTQRTVSDVLDTYHVSPAFKQGVFYNINAESAWDPYSRQVDQPKWGGEAHYSHGLLQEGGGDTRPLFDYAISKGKQWTDPETQMRYAFEQNPQGKAFLQKYGQSGDWREVASEFAKGYLRPREDLLQSRIRDIYGEKSQPPRITVTPNNYPDFANAHIDREHDVPLMAAGLMDNDGNVYGTAIDRRIPHYMTLDDESGKGPVTINSGQFVHGHEMTEIKEMERNLLSKGMKSSEAYTKAHTQTATPSEQAAVQQWARSQGRDPDKIWTNYQKFWSEQLGNVEKHEPVKVHPDTYLHPYDGHKWQTAMEKGSGRTIEDHPRELGMALPEEKMKEPRQEVIDKYKNEPGEIEDRREDVKGRAQTFDQIDRGEPMKRTQDEVWKDYEYYLRGMRMNQPAEDYVEGARRAGGLYNAIGGNEPLGNITKPSNIFRDYNVYRYEHPPYRNQPKPGSTAKPPEEKKKKRPPTS